MKPQMKNKILMSTMNRLLYYLCIVLMVAGISLWVLTVLQAFFGVEIFDEPPGILGVAFATIGGLMFAGFRYNRQES